MHNIPTQSPLNEVKRTEKTVSRRLQHPNSFYSTQSYNVSASSILPGNVIDHESSCCSSVVASCDSPESLLSCCIPDL